MLRVARQRRRGARRRRSAANIASSGAIVFGASAGDMYGRLMLQGAVARGAIGYLGIPFFATDYVADADGAIHPTLGYSADRILRASVDADFEELVDLFDISAPRRLPAWKSLAPGVPMWFDVKVRGSDCKRGSRIWCSPI